VGNEQVAALRCDTYDPQQVYETLQRGFELLGGVKKYIPQENKSI